ncbi:MULTISPECIES: hypothetical protein [Streptomyces]|uniref:Uncharacterized protein n=1 Tax=Streptomyces fradiae TaxID=1906 RepID=A0ACC4W448_STRFR|nr:MULTISPECIES: hypothetical protein [Streptomyces]KNE79431.1 hypothetical protein ADZ36_27635 [Streptomyces fradiae]
MNGSLHHREHGREATAAPATALPRLLAELRGPGAAPRPLDARALAALAANPGCRRRALLDGAGVDKSALARALGSPAGFGRSEFAFVRGNVFEARVRADGGAELIRLLRERFGADGPVPEPGEVNVPDLSAPGPEGRTARTRLALAEAFAGGGWTLLFHPMVRLDVAGSPAALEPDAVAVHPDGSCTVVEVKSFPVVDGSADAAKVGAAARQAAVYVLALRGLAEEIDRQPAAGGDATLPAQAQAQAQAQGQAGAPDAGPHGAGRVRSTILLVCPKDFSNLPTAEPVDVRKQLAVTRRQLDRLTRIEDIAAALPEGTTFDLRLADDDRTPTRPAEELAAAVDAVPAAYAPECLAACELAFHCRARSREAGAVEALGRGVRGELGGLTTVESVLEAAFGEHGDPADPAVAALRRAAALRAEALATAGDGAGRGELPATGHRKGDHGCR